MQIYKIIRQIYNMTLFNYILKKSPMVDIQGILQNDTIRLIMGLLIQMLLSYPIRFINHTIGRYFYSTVIGTILQYWVYGFPVVWIYLFGGLMYILTIGIPHKCGGIVTFLGMLFLSSYHLNALIYRYGEETMDQIVLLMILICKYSLFAYAYQDNHLAKTGKISLDKMTEERKKNLITEKVSIIDYFSYLQFLPTSLMGPPIQYRTYKLFMERQQHFAKIPSLKPVFIELGKTSAICGFFYACSLFVFPPSYLKSEQFWQNGFWMISFYTIVTLTLLRFKFYSGWNISIASIHMSGISYTEKNDFTGIQHCRPFIVETSPHIRDKISSWNVMVQQWLRKCIYQRSPFKSRMMSQLYVFIISAFWHGFYIGYYFSFVLWFAQLYLQGQIFKYTKIQGNSLSKIYQKLGPLAPFVVIFISNWFFSHNATYFYLLESHLCFRLMAKMYFIPPILIFSGIIFFMVSPGPKHKKV